MGRREDDGTGMDKRRLGEIVENMAAQLLESKGYEILQRNFRCKAGEIDIIALREGELCFVEVKTRQGFDFGRPCEAVTREKMRHIRSAARAYVEERIAAGDPPRRLDFQVIEIVAEHHRHAF